MKHSIKEDEDWKSFIGLNEVESVVTRQIDGAETSMAWVEALVQGEEMETGLIGYYLKTLD